MNERSDRALAVGLFALLCSVYLLTFSGIYHSSDEMSMLVATDSLARRGSWDIELIRWMGEQQGSFGPDGTLYSRKGIGTTLAALPLYWLALQSVQIGNVQAAMLTNAFITALCAACMVLLLRKLHYGRGASLATGLTFGLGTMAWPYARHLFSEPLAGLGLLLSAYGLVCYGHGDSVAPAPKRQPPARQTAETDQRPLSPWIRPHLRHLNLVMAGSGLGLALLSRLNYAVFAPFLGLLLLAYLYQHHGRGTGTASRRCRARSILQVSGKILLFVLPVAGALAIVAWYNWLRFGHPLTTGYLPGESFATPLGEGLYGLTFSPGVGLFWYNPVFLATLAAWPVFARHHRGEALLCAAVVLGSLVFYAPWYLWWAGHGWGPRFLVGALPFATLPLAEGFECAASDRALHRRTLAGGLVLLTFVSMGVQLLGVSVDFNLYLNDIFGQLGLYHPAVRFNPAYSPLWRQVAYLRPENLDFAWARDGSLNWQPLLVAGFLTLSSGLALGAAWWKQWPRWVSGTLLALLAAGTIFSLLRYAPAGDTAVTARALAEMERPGETAVLIDPILTEPFQDAYDGSLPLWGLSSRQELLLHQEAVWLIERLGGQATAFEREALQLQVGSIHLSLSLPLDQQFDTSRLPANSGPKGGRLGEKAELVTVCQENVTARRGESVSVALYWRALASVDRSYTLFVQAIGEGETKAGQIDRLPCGGGCPTTSWQPGDLVGEVVALPIRADIPPGRYRLITGMYDLASGEHLSWLDDQGRPLGPHLLLGYIDVLP